jgi:hypothetical protein
MGREILRDDDLHRTRRVDQHACERRPPRRRTRASRAQRDDGGMGNDREEERSDDFWPSSEAGGEEAAEEGATAGGERERSERPPDQRRVALVAVSSSVLGSSYTRTRARVGHDRNPARECLRFARRDRDVTLPCLPSGRYLHPSLITTHHREAKRLSADHAASRSWTAGCRERLVDGRPQEHEGAADGFSGRNTHRQRPGRCACSRLAGRSTRSAPWRA